MVGTTCTFNEININKEEIATLNKEIIEIKAIIATPLLPWFKSNFGENVQITKGKKAFTVTGKVDGSKFLSESFSLQNNFCTKKSSCHQQFLSCTKYTNDSLKTNMFKVQISFKEEFDQEKFKELNPISYKKVGSVATVIFKDEKEKVEEELRKMNPVILDFLSLTLEEIFIYEMEVIGYEFNQVLFQNFQPALV